MFLNVEDAHVRGTLRIFATLQKKGVKTLSSNQAGPSSPMQAERILVSPLLRWSQDLVQDDDNHPGDTYIACEAALFKSGPYRIIHEGVVLAKNNSFIGTLDLFGRFSRYLANPCLAGCKCFMIPYWCIKRRARVAESR
nr:uncharacterized protein LOC115257128 [Aedes albopictus]